MFPMSLRSRAWSGSCWSVMISRMSAIVSAIASRIAADVATVFRFMGLQHQRCFNLNVSLHGGVRVAGVAVVIEVSLCNTAVHGCTVLTLRLRHAKNPRTLAINPDIAATMPDPPESRAAGTAPSFPCSGPPSIRTRIRILVASGTVSIPP